MTTTATIEIESPAEIVSRLVGIEITEHERLVIARIYNSLSVDFPGRYQGLNKAGYKAAVLTLRAYKADGPVQ